MAAEKPAAVPRIALALHRRADLLGGLLREQRRQGAVATRSGGDKERRREGAAPRRSGLKLATCLMCPIGARKESCEVERGMLRCVVPSVHE